MRNIEKLRNYFLGKDPYLKETMADNSLRLIGIPGKEFVLRTEMLKRLQELKDHVDAADLVLQGEIDGLIHDLSAETLARQTQDGLLSQAINDEKIARQNGDTTLNNKFNNYYTKAQTDLKTFTTTLTEDLTVPENEEVTGLETGWYTTGDHFVYFGDNIEPVFENNAIFYFNSEHENQWFYVMPVNVVDGWNEIAIWLWFDTYDNIWQYSGHDIQTTISDSSTDNSVPTAAAVYEFVNGSYQPKLTEGTGIDITGNLISTSHDYSNTEQMVGVWTDGKGLFEKTIEVNVEAANRETVTINSIDTVFLENGFVQGTRNGVNYFTQIPYYYDYDPDLHVFSGEYISISVDVSTHVCTIVCYNDGNGDLVFHLTIRYTKPLE